MYLLSGLSGLDPRVLQEVEVAAGSVGIRLEKINCFSTKSDGMIDFRKKKTADI